MIALGFVAEVNALLAQHGRAVRPMAAVGYKQMAAHLLDGVPLDETEAAIERATLVYARRQRTWWKSDRSVFAQLTPDGLLALDPARLLG
jgi:tRNA dimethylallyltransferase